MLTSCHWILEKPSKDFAWILFPGFAAALYFLMAEADNTFYEVMAFIVMGMIDSGHVYSTLWRTYFHKEERISSIIYIWTPIVIFVIGFLWFHYQIPYLYSFIFYATAYHHIRQFYGVTKWYEKLDQSFTKWSGRFLYLLSLTPAIAAHFRSDLVIEFYTKKDLLMYPDQGIHKVIIGVNIILGICYLLYEINNYRTGDFKLNRCLSVVAPVVLYTSVFYIGKDGFQILLPLMVAHGIPYYAMLGVGLTRTRSSRFPTYLSVFKAVLLTAIIFGGFEFYFEREIIDFDEKYLYIPPKLWESMLLGLYVIPLMSHYTLDAFIWKSKHREGRLIFK